MKKLFKSIISLSALIIILCGFNVFAGGSAGLLGGDGTIGTLDVFKSTSGYIETRAAAGYDFLLKGTNRYLNFGTATSTAGYGLRDSSGTIQFKNSGGAWTGIGTGGSGSATTTINSISGPSFTLASTSPITLSASGTTFTWGFNNPGYITSSALTPYLTTSTAFSTYVPLGRSLTINGTAYDLSADRSWTLAGSATTTINSAAGPAFSFGTGTTGTDFAIATSSGTVTFNLPDATVSNRGLLSTSTFATFNNKVSSQWTTNGSNVYYTTGSVGIGTTDPGAKLDVQAPGLGNLPIAKFLNTDSNNQDYIFIGNSLSIARSAGFGFVDNSDASSGYAWVSVYGDNPASGTGLIVKKGGNVGIGVTNPASKLTVNGDFRLLGSSSGYVGFTSPAVVSTSTIWTLPTSDGSTNQVLTTNGSGILSWSTATGGSGLVATAFSATGTGLTIATTTTSVQYTWTNPGYISTTTGNWAGTFQNKNATDFAASTTVSMVYPGAGIALSGGSSWSASITNNSANWDTAYTDRLKWDGGSSGLTAATGRTSLGLGTAATMASTDFLASSTTYIANNSGDWAGTWQSKNASDFLASSTPYMASAGVGASLPTASSYTNQYYYLSTTDTLYRSNGTAWIAIN